MEELFGVIAQKIFELEDDRATKYRAWISGGGPLPAVGGFNVVSLFVKKMKHRIAFHPPHKLEFQTRIPDALGVPVDAPDDVISPLLLPDNNENLGITVRQVWYVCMVLSKIPELPKDWAHDKDSPWDPTTVIELVAILKSLLRVPEYTTCVAKDLEADCTL